jgi:hypothetical protein
MLAALLLAYGSAHGGFCGTERWQVKTMTDVDAGKVQLAPVRSSIAELVSLPKPTRVGGNRRAAAERRVATVDGYVVQVRNEADLDLHVVIADDDGYTMIIEFPDQACLSGSRVFAQANSAKKQLIRLLGNDPVRGNLKIRVTGVVFFDKFHNQSGVAANAVELHPVLAVQALEGARRVPLPDPPAPEPPTPDRDGANAQHSRTNPPPGGCCKVCRSRQPCGDSCISRTRTCQTTSGCACWPR